MGTMQLPQHGDSSVEARGQLASLAVLLPQLPPGEIPLRHYFAEGVYAREGVVPAGTMFLGRVHKQSQINIVQFGRISVLTERGLVHLQGPCTWVSPAGAQRAAYAHTDVLWTTFLGTHQTDPDEIYTTLTAATYEDYQEVCAEFNSALKE